MKTGAVALIDALGFRGIWQRHSPEDVLAALISMKDWYEKRIDEQFRSQSGYDCNVTFLSDSIAVSMALSSCTKDREALSVIYLADIISWVLERVLRSQIPLAYRGAIATGDYEITQHFVIGPAVDEAAAAHNLAQGAIIWLTPKAREQVASWLKENPDNTHLVRCDVPLKGGDMFHTYTVSPLEQAQGQDDANRLVAALLPTFAGSSVDVAVKRQNTLRHLQSCYEWRGLTFPAELSVS